MSLQFFLSLRRRYNDIIINLGNTIMLYTEVVDSTIKPEQFYIRSKARNSVFICEQDLKTAIFIKKICDEKIEQLCEHEYICDNIDINPDRSESIIYCGICESKIPI